MTEYRVEVKLSARKEVERFDDALLKRIVQKLESLAINPRPPGCKKLKGFKDQWRLRAGDYRIVYIINESERTISVTRVQHRRDVYEP